MAAAAYAGCGPLPPSPEHQVLTGFFDASRVRDTTVLARFGSVVFEPRRDGVVQRFEVVDVSDDGAAKTVTIRARVRTPEGQTVERMLAFSMTGSLVTGFRQLPDGQTSPAASSSPPN